MADNQITPFQLTDQFTMDNFNQRIEETNTALANKLGGIESTEYPGCYYRMVSGVVEWFNPPMTINTEYRTTERFNSRPVYKQVFSLGELSTAGKTEYLVFGEDEKAGQHFIISADFYATNSRYGDGGWGITLPSFNVDGSVGMEACYTGLRVEWYNVRSFSGYYGFAILKYVKPYEAT